MSTRNIRGPLALVTSAAAAGAVLLVLDGGALASPRTWNLRGWTELLDARGPASTAMTALRCIALAAAAYVLLLGVVALLVRLSRVRWLDALLTFATPRVLRPALGLVTVATFAAPHAAGATEGASAPPVMVLVGSDARTATSTTLAPASPAPTMRRVDPPPSTTTPPTTSVVTTSTMPSTTTRAASPGATIAVTIAAPPVVSGPAAKAPAPAPPATWTITRGEHLWYVAETVLTERLARAPSTVEITTFWQQVIRANHDRLADPENPDLVFAGQELVLPPA